MLVFLVIAILVLSVIAAPIRVGMHFYLNLFENDGFIKIYLFGIRIFHAAIRFEHDADRQNNLIVSHGKKSDEIHLNTNPQDKKSITVLMKHPAMAGLQIKKLSAHFTAGKTNDAFFTVALMQSLRVLFYGVMAPIKCRYAVAITESFHPVYNRDVLESDFIGIIQISIADIIVSFLQSKRQAEPRQKQEVANT